MSRILLLASLLPLFLLLSCGDPSPSSVMQDQIDYMDRFAGILADVKDPASAEAAKSKIESLIGDMSELKKQAEAMEPPTPEDLAALEKEYMAKAAAVGAKVDQEMKRIRQDPALLEKLREAFKKFDDM